MPDLVTKQIPQQIYRVGRVGHMLSYSEISPQDAMLQSAGNRFDVPGGAVLYAATQRVACYAETLARFRTTPKMREVVGDEDGFMNAGTVPQDWRLQRRVGRIAPRDALPFLDVEDPATQAFLSAELSSELRALGYDDNLDISTVCNQDRRLSRQIALYAYTAADELDAPLYSGIRYVSRVHPKWECWAIFAGTTLEVVQESAILPSDPALKQVEQMWDIKIF